MNSFINANNIISEIFHNYGAGYFFHNSNSVGILSVNRWSFPFCTVLCKKVFVPTRFFAARPSVRHRRGNRGRGSETGTAA